MIQATVQLMILTQSDMLAAACHVHLSLAYCTCHTQTHTDRHSKVEWNSEVYDKDLKSQQLNNE